MGNLCVNLCIFLIHWGGLASSPIFCRHKITTKVTGVTRTATRVVQLNETTLLQCYPIPMNNISDKIFLLYQILLTNLYLRNLLFRKLFFLQSKNDLIYERFQLINLKTGGSNNVRMLNSFLIEICSQVVFAFCSKDIF